MLNLRGLTSGQETDDGVHFEFASHLTRNSSWIARTIDEFGSETMLSEDTEEYFGESVTETHSMVSDGGFDVFHRRSRDG